MDRAWERPASVELINPDGTPGFPDQRRHPHSWWIQLSRESNPKARASAFFPLGIRRLQAQLSAQVRTCDEWLAANPWAPGPEVCPTDEFDSVDLRTFENYSWSFGG
jgi:hypothetical protein